MTSTIGSEFNRACEKFADRTALVFGEKTYSYSELKENVDRAAKGLIQLGVEKGDKVTIWMPNNPEWIYTFFAAAKIGAIAVPANTRLKSSELSYILKQSDTKYLVTTADASYCDYLQILRDTINSTELSELSKVITVGESEFTSWSAMTANEATQEELDARENEISFDDTLYIMYTSGTTGFPKGVMHDHSPLKQCWDICERLEITQDDVFINYLPLFHVFGLYHPTICSILMGAKHVLMPLFDPIMALQLLEEHQATRIFGFETHYLDLLNSPQLEKTDVSSLKIGVLPAGLKTVGVTAPKVEEKICPTVSTFGMTELGVGAALSLPSDQQSDRWNWSGIPMPDCHFRVVDPESRSILPFGQIGELEVKSSDQMIGYYKKEEETQKATTEDGWIRSGDMAEMREDGTVKYIGRYKEMIKVGGENVDPVEVETYLQKLSGNDEIKIVGVPDSRLGQVCCAAMLDSKIKIEDLKSLCEGQIASFKIPRHVVSVDEFPMTASGKLKRVELANTCADKCT